MAHTTAANAAVQFEVALADIHAHLFQVTLTLTPPSDTQALRLPVWIPGSYLVREFAKNLQNLCATQGKRAVDISQSDKASWLVHCQAGKPLQVQYEVYAFDSSVRTAWLDSTRGFFNGTSLFLLAEGFEDGSHSVAIAPPVQATGWQLATGLTPSKTDKQGFGLYTAADYDTLVDCPVEMGPFWSGSFVAGGIPHRFVVAGAPPSFDGSRLLADTQAICEEEIRLWHADSYQKESASRNIDGRQGPIPYKNYLFVLNAVHDGYGGLEHRNSTALICNRKDLPRLPLDTDTAATKPPEGYTTLLGLISHEYFHTWNVKRLRPAEFTRYDYRAENYTELLWFFEGFTSYYDDLLLRRSGRIDTATYLKLLTKTINQVNQTPGRLVQTVAQASFDAWVKYYRQDENTANATVSYYTKGSLVALCLDLTLRAEGHTTLDDTMRALWVHCAGGPMTEQDLLTTLAALGKRSFGKDLERWVHSTRELPYAELLERHGVQVNREPDQLAQRLGLRVKESGGVHIQQVLRGGAAEKAGFASGDEWLAVGASSAKAPSMWRLSTLDELLLYAGKANKLSAIVARDKRVLTLQLSVPKPSMAVRLSVRDAAVVSSWLDA